MTGGFTVVDPRGNWIRISASNDNVTHDSNHSAGSNDGAGSNDSADSAGGLERVLLNAARHGDSHGDEARAIAVVDAGLVRHPDASPAERVPVLLYLADLLIRSGQFERAALVLAEFRALDLDDGARSRLGDEFAVADDLESRP
jgi:hypothetical protein